MESGAEAPVHEVDVTKSPLLKIWISGYEWSSSISIEPSSDPTTLTLLDSHKRTLSISAQIKYMELCRHFNPLVIRQKEF